MRCDPADKIIKALGGLKSVSGIANVAPHTVMRWRMPKEKGGTGGVIPHWHMESLLLASAQMGAKLKPSDFLPVTERAA